MYKTLRASLIGFAALVLSACGTGFLSEATETSCDLVKEYYQSYVKVGEPSLELIGVQLDLCRKGIEADAKNWESKWDNFAKIIEDALKSFLGGIVIFSAESDKAVAAIDRAAALRHQLDTYK